MTISRMQQQRQMYGLGSLVKSITKGVKSAVKGVTKAAKSPLGLAALATIPFGGPTAAFGALKNKALPFLMGQVQPQSGGQREGGLFSGIRNFFRGEPTFGKTLGMFGLGTGAALALQAAGLDTENPNEMPKSVDALRGYLKRGYLQLNQDASPEEAEEFAIQNTSEYATGGRVGFDEGGYTFEQFKKDKFNVDQFMGEEQMKRLYEKMMREKKVREQRNMAAYGGRISYAMGSPEENAIQASGIMNLPLNQNKAGVTELDLRETGGFIPPVGVKEKADDIPAMLSNNEFVFTADAVRGMGDGNVNKGAQRLYDQMKMLEKGGRV